MNARQLQRPSASGGAAPIGSSGVVPRASSIPSPWGTVIPEVSARGTGG